MRRASRPERLDDDQASATAGTREGEEARPVGCVGAVGVGRESSEQFADAGDVGGAIAVSQEAVVADAVLALGEDVGEESADEFDARNLSRSDLVRWHETDIR